MRTGLILNQIHQGNLGSIKHDMRSATPKVGSMLFTLCCGRPPFGAGSIQVGYGSVAMWIHIT